MRELITIEDNEPFLRQISKPVNFDDKDLLKDIEDLKEYSLNHLVFAMAAVQIGIPKRLVFLKSVDETKRDGSETQMVLINPEIISSRGRTRFFERCQSCLQYGAFVERPYEIVVRYQNIEGQTITQTFDGFSATVLSHEFDHLDGILHMDRAKEVLVCNTEEALKCRKNNPYKIISKTCKFSYEDIK